MVDSRFEKGSIKRMVMPVLGVFAAAVIAIVMGFSLVGCSSDSPSNSSNMNVAPVESSSSSAAAAAGDISVGITLEQSVVAPEVQDTADQFSGEETTVNVAEGATALDALQATDREVTTSGSGDSVEIESIGGLGKGDAGASSHWEFSVNGQVMTESPAVYVVSNGDKLTFNFVD